MAGCLTLILSSVVAGNTDHSQLPVLNTKHTSIVNTLLVVLITTNTHIILWLLGDEKSRVVDVNKVSNRQNLKRVFFPQSS